MISKISLHKGADDITITVKSVQGKYALQLGAMAQNDQAAVLNCLAGWRERNYRGPFLSRALHDKCLPFLAPSWPVPWLLGRNPDPTYLRDTQTNGHMKV